MLDGRICYSFLDLRCSIGLQPGLLICGSFSPSQTILVRYLKYTIALRLLLTLKNPLISFCTFGCLALYKKKNSERFS